MKVVKNTIVQVEFRLDPPDSSELYLNGELKFGSIRALPRTPDLAEPKNLRGCKGVGELIVAPARKLRPFTPGQMRRINNRFLKVVAADGFTHLRNYSYSISQGERPLHISGDAIIDGVRGPLLISMAFDYRSKEFLDAVFITLAEFAKVMKLKPEEDFELVDTAQYSWVILDDEFKDISVPVAKRYGFDFSLSIGAKALQK